MDNIKTITSFLFCLISVSLIAQSYAPAAEEEGTTAIKYDSTIFVNWATGIEVERGFIDIADPTKEYQGDHRATFGEPEIATGPITSSSTTNCVSLGDSGVAIVTFEYPISNGEGFDFAVFENGLSDSFLELGLVEVSSDGVNYVRFPAHSQTQTEEQIDGFGSLDPTYLYNLAGKYRVGYGTPFDLEELKDSANIDINNITHVKIIDVIGSIDEHFTVDAHGNKINDPYPTPFHSGGFDLSGVGVIHENKTSDVSFENAQQLTVYPNPSHGKVNIEFSENKFNQLIIYNQLGQEINTVKIQPSDRKISMELPKGIYTLVGVGKQNLFNQRIVVQ